MSKYLKAVLMLSGVVFISGCVEDDSYSSSYSSGAAQTATYQAQTRTHHNQGYSTSQENYPTEDGYSTSAQTKPKINQSIAPAGSSGFQSSTGVAPESTTTSTTTTTTSSAVPVENAPVSSVVNPN